MNNSGYQQTTPSAVVGAQHQSSFLVPRFLNQGLRVGGTLVSGSCIVYFGIVAAIMTFSGIIIVARGRNINRTVIIGNFFLTIGIMSLVVVLGTCLFAYKQHKRFSGFGNNRQLRFMRENAARNAPIPQQPGIGVVPQPFGMQPPTASGYYQPQSYGFTVTGQPDLVTCNPGLYMPYPQQAGITTGQFVPSYPENPVGENVNSADNESVPSSSVVCDTTESDHLPSDHASAPPPTYEELAPPPYQP